MATRTSIVTRSILLAVLACSGCSGGGSGGGGDPQGASSLPPVSSISLSPGSLTVGLSGSEQVLATVRDANGNVLAGAPLVWTSSNPASAAVDGAGEVTGLAAGTATVMAAHGSVASNRVSVTVAAIQAVTVSPVTPSIPVGSTQQFAVTVTDAAGAAITGTTVRWTSSNPAVAGIAATGVATGLVPGTTTITASAGGIPSQPVVLAVTSPGLSSANALSVSLGTDLNNGINRPMVSLKLCVPGSAVQCTTVSNVILDSGSTGLRLLKAAVPVPLPAVPVPAQASRNLPAGSVLAECYPFVTSNAWGTVNAADVYLAGEPALSGAAVHLLDGAFAGGPPVDGSTGLGSSCATNGFDLLTMTNLSANGILGVLPMQYDNKPAGNLIPANEYWACAAGGGSCTLLEGLVPGMTATVAKGTLRLVANPVFGLPADNNGLVFDFPGVPAAGAVAAEGRLLFGIGTAANNHLPSSAAVLAYDPFARVTVVYNQAIVGTPSSVPLDTGNPVTDFSASVLGEPLCTTPGLQHLLCPAALRTFSVGLGSTQSLSTAKLTPTLAVGNATALLTNTSNRLFDSLVAHAGTPSLGLPFFMGKTIYMGFPSSAHPYGYVAF